jgi:hypothetical protein
MSSSQEFWWDDSILHATMNFGGMTSSFMLLILCLSRLKEEVVN